MNYVIFNDGTRAEITSASKNGNTIKLVGEVPANTHGFKLYRSINPTVPLDYSNFTTVYRIEGEGVTFSNDGSVYTKTVTVKVIWDDSSNYDGIRPDNVDVDVYKDEELLETITLSENNEWKKEYTDSVTIPSYSVDGKGVQAYEERINGLTIVYYHQADIPVPPPTPDLEERVTNLETDMSNLNYVIGGMVE